MSAALILRNHFQSVLSIRPSNTMRKEAVANNWASFEWHLLRAWHPAYRNCSRGSSPSLSTGEARAVQSPELLNTTETRSVYKPYSQSVSQSVSQSDAGHLQCLAALAIAMLYACENKSQRSSIYSTHLADGSHVVTHRGRQLTSGPRPVRRRSSATHAGKCPTRLGYG